MGVGNGDSLHPVRAHPRSAGFCVVCGLHSSDSGAAVVGMNRISRISFPCLFLAGAIVATSSDAFGQVEIQLRARQLPGWDARAREGRCEIRVWVDNRAEVRMRGDTIFVRTL